MANERHPEVASIEVQREMLQLQVPPNHAVELMAENLLAASSVPSLGSAAAHRER